MCRKEMRAHDCISSIDHETAIQRQQDTDMPLGLWGEALQYVKHTYNLTPYTAFIARRCDVPIPHVLFHNESAERLARLHAQLLPFGMSYFVHKVENTQRSFLIDLRQVTLLVMARHRACIGFSLLMVYQS
jgi:hypothetical protein